MKQHIMLKLRTIQEKRHFGSKKTLKKWSIMVVKRKICAGKRRYQQEINLEKKY